MTGSNERLRCLTLINNRKSIFQQLAVNDNFHELSMHSSGHVPAAAAEGGIHQSGRSFLPARIPSVVFLLFP